MFYILEQSPWINFSSNRYSRNKQRNVHNQRNWPYFTPWYSSRSFGQIIDYKNNQLRPWGIDENPCYQIFNIKHQAFTWGPRSTGWDWFKNFAEILRPIGDPSMGFYRVTHWLWWRMAVLKSVHLIEYTFLYKYLIISIIIFFRYFHFLGSTWIPIQIIHTKMTF